MTPLHYRVMKKLLIAIPLVLIVTIAAGYLLSTTPSVEIKPAVTVIGEETPVTVHAASNHGIRRVTAIIEQNGKRYPVYEVTEPARRGVLFRDEQGLRRCVA